MKPRTVRSVSTLRWGVISPVVTLGFIALAVFSSNGGRVVGAVFAALFIVMTWRVWVTGIRVEEDGIKVVGVLVSRRVAWRDIDHFAVLPLGNYPWVGSRRPARRSSVRHVWNSRAWSAETRTLQTSGPGAC
jgi:hypothetical protein